jgi:hypothetical protein
VDFDPHAQHATAREIRPGPDMSPQRDRRPRRALRALATLARTAPDVTSAPADGGATRFTATISASEIPATFGPRWDAFGDRARLEATVGDDGVVHAIALGAPSKSVTITFEAIGQPQEITAP